MKKLISCLLILIISLFCFCCYNSFVFLPGEGATSEIKPYEAFASNISKEGELNLSWNYKEATTGAKMTVETPTETFEKVFTRDENEYKLKLEQDKLYKFKIIFETTDEGASDNIVEFSRFFSESAKNVNFPRMEINTKNSILPTADKVSAPKGYLGGSVINNEYVYSVVKMYDENNKMIYRSASDGHYSRAQIKIRGNTSTYTEKKPLKLKLYAAYDMLIDLVDGRKNKRYESQDWILLKCGNNLNQIVGTTVNQTVGSEFTTKHAYLSLFVNGDYKGLYVLSEDVDRGDVIKGHQGRCAIEQDGYIIEQDAYWWNSELYFKTPMMSKKSNLYTFIYPNPKNLQEGSTEFEYIKNYITEMEQFLVVRDNENLKKYIDYESFAKWILTQDYIGNADPCGSNIYLTKKDSVDSLLCMGPTWDYDAILGLEGFSYVRHYFYYQYLFHVPEFVNVYKSIYNETKDKVLTNVKTEISKINKTGYDVLIEYEYKRYGTDDRTIDENMVMIEEWFENKIAWLDENI